jgi:hypothetical protein
MTISIGKTPGTHQKINGMTNTRIKQLLVLILVLLPFMDTASKKQNRLYNRMNGAQIEELIFTLRHLASPIND